MRLRLPALVALVFALLCLLTPFAGSGQSSTPDSSALLAVTRMVQTEAAGNDSRESRHPEITSANGNTVPASAFVGALSGRVTKAGTSTAIAGATITLLQGTTTISTTTTNSSGDYSFSGLTAGTYTVQAMASGYETKISAASSVADNTTTTVDLSLSVPINYVYDSLGRLIAVMDASGNAATYSYDAVGNLLGIGRQTATQVSLASFAPSSGVIGATVILYGTGFTETASQNTVTFNGTAATVVSSSLTQLVVTVPSGATSGAIAVTTALGSATSGSSFTVNSTSGATTITSFTPTIATSGTAVTITGTNFDTTASNNRTTFNIGDAVVGSATATSIATTVPATGSGRITVATPNGTAVSSADFFIPPAVYTAASVNFTGRMTVGSNSAITITTASKIGMMLFDGIAGQRVSLSFSSGTIAAYNVSVYNPDGAIFYNSITLTTSGGLLDTATLPTTGTYTAIIAPTSTYTGSVTLTLADITDAIGTISANGTPVAIATTMIRQNAKLTFSGTAGQRVSLKIISTVFNLVASIIAPNGQQLVAQGFNGGSGTFFEPLTLGLTGTYTIYMDSSGDYIGTNTCTLYTVPADVSGSITLGGSPLTVTITTPGQNGLLTFSGTAGQRVSMNHTGVTLTSCTTYLKKPDGTNLTQTGFGTGGAFMDAVTLPTTGTYSILVDPSGWVTGSVTLTLYNATEATGSITPGGAAATITITSPGQNAALSFSGSSGQRVSMKVNSATFNANYLILKPDGSTLSSKSGGTGAFMDTVTLPVTGTYTLYVNPDYTSTGTATVTLYDVPADLSGTITLGSPYAATIATPGQNGLLTFSGTAAQVISLQLTGVTLSSCTVYIKKPDNSTLTQVGFGTAGAFVEPLSLPTTGTYSLFIEPSGDVTGNLTLGLYSVVDVTGSLTVNDPATAVTLNTPGQRGQVTFSGTASQQITVRVTGNTITGTWVRLLKPDGSVLTQSFSSSSSFNLTTQTLATTGTYTVVVDPDAAKTGSLNLQVTSP